MRHPYSLAILASTLIALSACDPRLVDETLPGVIVPEGSLGSDKVEQTGDACYKETYHQPDVARTDKVDILFVIDTSASLILERGRVGMGIDKFIKELPKNSHYRIGVLLAHGKRSRWSGKLFNNGLPIMPIVMDSKTHSLAWIRINLQLRLQLTGMDYWSDGGEATYYSLNKALEESNLAKIQKQGFFRNDAALSVVIVSDENELCYDYPSNVTPRPDHDLFQGRTLESIAREENCEVKDGRGQTQWLTAAYMNSRLKAVKGAQPFSVSAIMHTSKTIKNLLPRAEDEYGYGYDDLVRLSGGTSVNIRDRDYSEGLERIGRNTSTSMTLYQKFALTHSDIEVSSLAVHVDAAPRTDFSWLASESSVFVQDPGGPKSTIEIDYCRLQDDTGGGVDNPPGDDDNTGGGVDNPPGDDDNTGGGVDNPPGDDDNTGGGDGGTPGDDGGTGGDDGEPGDGGDLPGGCTAVDCPDIGL
jgi:hypothetical protein